MRRTGAIVLTAVLSLVVLTWGTCPCLYANALAGHAEGEAPCSCCVGDAAQAAPTESGSDDCPTCSSVGCMHELPPVGDRVALDAPVLLAFLPVLDLDGPLAAECVAAPSVEYVVPPAVSTEVLIL